jgi:DNA-binding response OmpR family regulator
MGEPFLISPAPRAAARRRLLLVDDDLSVAKFLAHAAEECGLEAIITVTAESFRSQFRALAPDTVVLDLGLPGSDGVELLRFLAEEACKARIILVSGFDQRVLEAAMRLGAAMGLRMAPPLHKPVRLNLLMATIMDEEVEDDPCLG